MSLLVLALALAHVPPPPPPRPDAGVAVEESAKPTAGPRATRITTPPTEAEARAASMNGRYRGLLAVLQLPDDARSYGEVRDYGFWSGTSYAGVDDLPKAYWVYVHPRWYLWKEPAQAPVNAPPSESDKARAACDGKYSELKHVLYAPEDQATYGAFNDYGLSSSTSYRQFDGLTPGYWVYVAPRWFIFARQKRTAPETPRALPPPLPPFGLSTGPAKTR